MAGSPRARARVVLYELCGSEQQRHSNFNLLIVRTMTQCCKSYQLLCGSHCSSCSFALRVAAAAAAAAAAAIVSCRTPSLKPVPYCTAVLARTVCRTVQCSVL